MKYVLFKSGDGSKFAIMGLGIGLIHSDLAAAFPKSKPISAGRVRFSDTGEVETFGESTSLNLKPDPADAKFFSAFYRAEVGTRLGHGFERVEPLIPRHD
jgi:hypothetical protein